MTDYVYIKTVSGDQLISEMVNVGTNSIFLKNPMWVSTQKYEDKKTGEPRTSTVASPWINLSNDKVIEVYLHSLIFKTPLIEYLIPYYKNLVEYYENKNRDIEDEVNELDWDELDEDELEVEEDETEDQENPSYFKGNKTLN